MGQITIGSRFSDREYIKYLILRKLLILLFICILLKIKTMISQNNFNKLKLKKNDYFIKFMISARNSKYLFTYT